MKRYKLYIVDLDGTIYRGKEVLPNAAETMARLKAAGSLVRYLTNNSGQTRAFYAEKLQRMGLEVELEEIFSSAVGAAKVCREERLDTVFYIGEPGLRETLLEGGISVCNEEHRTVAGSPRAVIAGICRSFTYAWMNAGMQHILGGAQFIATNTDATYPLEQGRIEPGAGAIVSSIEMCSGVAPRVIGKPEPLLIEMILAATGVNRGDALAVGDRYDTDIVSGIRAGVDTHLVLTGVTKQPVEGVSWSEDLSGLVA